jgi:hypothetical protein
MPGDDRAYQVGPEHARLKQRMHVRREHARLGQKMPG